MTKRRPTGKPKAKQSKKSTATIQTGEDNDLVDMVDQLDAAAATATPDIESSSAARRLSRLSRQQVKTLALEVEYAYVVNDLRRVFTLAAIMIVGLIVVNLAFTYLGS